MCVVGDKGERKLDRDRHIQWKRRQMQDREERESARETETGSGDRLIIFLFSFMAYKPLFNAKSGLYTLNMICKQVNKVKWFQVLLCITNN